MSLEHHHSLAREFYRELKRPTADCDDALVHDLTPQSGLEERVRIDLTKETHPSDPTMTAASEAPVLES